MKKKGFTLIELLAVIVILGVIALIVSPIVLGIIRKSEKASFARSIDGIIESVKIDHVSDQFLAPREYYFEQSVLILLTVSDNKRNELININGRIDGNGFVHVDGEGKITIDKICNKKYCASGTEDNIIITENETGELTEFDRSEPIITLNGSQIIYVELNGTYTELGAIARTIVGDKLEYTTEVKQNGIVVNKIDTSKEGEYTIIYSATSNDKTVSVTRTITVEGTVVISFADQLASAGSSQVASKDPDGNKRYIGLDPKNYVKFNNELWRVIGVFNGQAKIIRNDFYSTSIAWDSNDVNDWSKASLKNELNTTYLNSIEATSKSYIDQTHVWNLGGTPNYTSSTRAQYYTAERGTKVYSGNATTWTGAIGLMYPSDWAYASSSTNSICDTTVLYDWDSGTAKTECAKNSWLYNSSTHQWTLTLRSDESYDVLFVRKSGSVDYSGASKSYGVRPVLYLKSNVKIKSGTGSDRDPFILMQS